MDKMLVTVIIPALNEAENIEACLKSLACQPEPWEALVVDGGSSDATPTLAAPYARVLAAPRGRAFQMNVGVHASNGEALLFLHADTRLHPGALAALRLALADPGTAGGTFTMRFDRDTALFRAYGAFTHLPLLYLHYGDQGIFCRRSIFERLNGYREIGLMEDIDLLRRMRLLGRRALLPYPVTTLARRFTRHGLLRQQALNILLVGLYILGADPDRLARWYRLNKG